VDFVRFVTVALFLLRAMPAVLAAARRSFIFSN